MSPYAAETEVPIERSKAQIEAMLRQRGATDYASGWSETEDRIQFRMHNVTIRFSLPRAKRADYLTDNAGRERRPAVLERMMAQADRSRWRSLYLVIKAKLEAVDAGISIYEEEFLAFVVMADGRTVGSCLVPQITAGKQLQIGDGK